MPESRRESQRAPLQRLVYLCLGLLFAAGVGAVGCKPHAVETEPAVPATAAEPVEPADDDAARDDADTRPTTEVTDPGFQTQGMEDDDVERMELTNDEMARRLQDQLRTVFFGYDQSELSETTRRVLETNAQTLSLTPGFTVIIEGHCDERGTIEYNLALGQRRAESVREYLVSLGVEASRMRTVSYGEERPVDTANSESAWSRNRRAAFVVE